MFGSMWMLNVSFYLASWSIVDISNIGGLDNVKVVEIYRLDLGEFCVANAYAC